MGETKLDIPILQPGEKVIGVAYLTVDDGVVFTAHPGGGRRRAGIRLVD